MGKKKLIKWVVSPKEKGPYACFRFRSWPNAYYQDGSPAGHISCPDPYNSFRAREHIHGPLTVRIAVHKETGAGFTYATIKMDFNKLEDAKQALEDYIHKTPDVMPKSIKGGLF